MQTPLCPLFYLSFSQLLWNKVQIKKMRRYVWMQNTYLDMNWSSLATLLNNIQKEYSFFSSLFNSFSSFWWWTFIELMKYHGFSICFRSKRWCHQSHGRRNGTFAEVKNVEKQIGIWWKIRRKWETGSISLVVLILVIVTLATRQTATAMHHCQPSLMSALVRVRHCFLLVGVVSAWRGMLQQPRLPSLTRLWEGGRPNYMIHRAPNSPYSPQLTFINYSLLF